MLALIAIVDNPSEGTGLGYHWGVNPRAVARQRPRLPWQAIGGFCCLEKPYHIPLSIGMWGPKRPLPVQRRRRAAQVQNTEGAPLAWGSVGDRQRIESWTGFRRGGQNWPPLSGGFGGSRAQLRTWPRQPLAIQPWRTPQLLSKGVWGMAAQRLKDGQQRLPCALHVVIGLNAEQRQKHFDALLNCPVQVTALPGWNAVRPRTGRSRVILGGHSPCGHGSWRRAS